MGVVQAVKKTNTSQEEYGLNIFKRKFQGIFSRGKEKYLTFDYAQEFINSLNSLRKGLGDRLRQIFLTAEFPNNWQEIRQEILDVGGFIGPVLCENPGSAQFMDLLYRYKEPQGPLDKFLMNCKSGRAVDYRKAATIGNITPVLLSLIQAGQFKKRFWKRITVLNLGSGCGYDSMEISSKNSAIAQYASFINIDIDKEALRKGASLLNKIEYSDLPGISFHSKNMLHVNIKNAHMAWIIGILCSFSQRDCIRYLRITKSFLTPGGIVYGACVTDQMLNNDLFTCFVLEYILNWRLCYRKQGQVKEMFEAAGYIWRPELIFQEEPTRYYVIGAGEVPS